MQKIVNLEFFFDRIAGEMTLTQFLPKSERYFSWLKRCTHLSQDWYKSDDGGLDGLTRISGAFNAGDFRKFQNEEALKKNQKRG